MMGSWYNKFAVALALLVALVLGGVSFTQAHENLSVRAILPLAPHGAISHALAHSTGYFLRPGLDCEACDPATPLTGGTATRGPLSTPLAVPDRLLAYKSPHGLKVSLHMLDSVLLI
jgi:hypothetical protein